MNKDVPFGHAVTRPFLEGAMNAAFGLARLPRPADIPYVHTVGPDPDRILLLGTAAVAGVGVSSHQLGLGGRLARRVSALTSRGVDLDIEGSVTLSVRDALAAVTVRSAGHYDVAVLFVGARESMGLQPIHTWTKQLRELLRGAVEADVASHVIVIGVPAIHRYATLPKSFAERMRRHVERQNEATATICAEFTHVSFVSLSHPMNEASYQLGSAAYETWAEVLAPPIAAQLDCIANRSRMVAPVNEGARQAALDALNVIDSEADPRIDRIAQTARDLLGASGASVTFLDHHRQWMKSAASMSSRDTARAGSFCDTTIRQPGLFIVEDAAAADDFAGHPWVVGKEQVRFYAGYPLEAPGGERVGALCVVDTKPRRFTDREAALLRELALRIQTVLWEK